MITKSVLFPKPGRETKPYKLHFRPDERMVIHCCFSLFSYRSSDSCSTRLLRYAGFSCPVYLPQARTQYVSIFFLASWQLMMTSQVKETLEMIERVMSKRRLVWCSFSELRTEKKWLKQNSIVKFCSILIEGNNSSAKVLMALRPQSDLCAFETTRYF